MSVEFTFSALTAALNTFVADMTTSCLKYSMCFSGSSFVFRLVMSTDPVCIINVLKSPFFNSVGMTSVKFKFGNIAGCFATFLTLSCIELYALAFTNWDCVASSRASMFTLELMESPIYRVLVATRTGAGLAIVGLGGVLLGSLVE